MSDLGSLRVSRLSLSIGLVGTWRAEVWCDEGRAPTGRLVLTVGDLLLKGVALRGGEDAPDAPHVVHTGAPGWDRAVGASTTGADGTTITSTTAWLSYANDNGVRLWTVLRDLAKRAGEVIELPANDVVLGRNWVVIASRPGEAVTLHDALGALVHGRHLAAMRVDLDGITRFGERTGTAVDADKANIMQRDNGAGWVKCGSETFASLMPGNTLEGHTIIRLDVNERPGSLESVVWTRVKSAADMVLDKGARRWPQLRYGGCYTYRVGAVATDGRLDLDPPADAAYLPPLARVEQWTLGGAKVKPRVGSLALVMFRDASPARPVVVGLQPLADSTPTETTIDADAVKMGAGALTVIRTTDYVTLDTVTTPGRTRIVLDPAPPAPTVSKVKA